MGLASCVSRVHDREDLAVCATIMMSYWCTDLTRPPRLALEQAGLIDAAPDASTSDKASGGGDSGAGSASASGAAAGTGAGAGAGAGAQTSTPGVFATFSEFEEFYFRDPPPPTRARPLKRGTVFSDNDPRMAFHPLLVVLLPHVKQKLLNTKSKRATFAQAVKVRLCV